VNKLFVIGMLTISSLFATNCNIYKEKALKNMKEANDTYSYQIRIYRQLEAMNYLKLYELCIKKLKR